LGSKKSWLSRLRALSTDGGSPGRCFLNSSISAPSSERVTSVSASIVLRMYSESSKSLRISSSVL
jgi:hypothetical protein